MKPCCTSPVLQRIILRGAFRLFLQPNRPRPRRLPHRRSSDIPSSSASAAVSSSSAAASSPSAGRPSPSPSSCFPEPASCPLPPPLPRFAPVRASGGGLRRQQLRPPRPALPPARRYVGLLFAQIAHRHQLVRLDDRQVVVAQESFFNQAVGQFRFDARSELKPATARSIARPAPPGS